MIGKEFIVHGCILYNYPEESTGPRPQKRYSVKVLEEICNTSYFLCKITPIEYNFNCSFKMVIMGCRLDFWYRAHVDIHCVYKKKNMKMKEDLKRTYMRVALEFARMSRCQRAKVGAVAVKNGSILAHGWNGTPSGYKTNTCELPDGKTDPFVLHAEENIIVKMAKSTESLAGASIFCTLSPCCGCAKLLAQMGIDTFYYLDDYHDDAGLRCLELLGIKIEKITNLDLGPLVPLFSL